MNRPTPRKRRRLPTVADLQRETRRPLDTDPQTRELDPLCRLWALRVLVELGALEELCRGDVFSAPQLLHFVGVQPRPVDGNPGPFVAEFDRKAAMRQARQRLREQSAPGVAVLPEDSIAARHLLWLRAELGLSELQAQVLLLCVMARRNVHLGVTLCSLGDLSTLRLYTVLATVLGTSVEAAAKAMERTGTLAVSGLARVDHNGQYEFPAKIDLLHGVTERLLVDHTDRFSLFADNFVMSGTPRLGCERFGHLGDRLEHLKAYLGQAVRAGTAGVNVLVYGPPGTGKTELSRALAAALQVQLFEVSVVSAQGQRIPGRKRLAAFELTQQILARRGQSVVLFDEIEDIDEVAGDDDDDDDMPRPLRRPATGRKGWFNRLLETNPVPAIWVTNRIGHIDAAHLRRFDLHLQMDTPPSAVRSAMLAEQTAELGTTPAWCRRMAAHTRLAPGVITRAARVVSSIRSAGVETPAEALLEEVIGASLTAQRIGQALPAATPALLAYDVHTAQASADLGALVEGLRRQPSARLCFYGPPGTGKSAFAQHLARELGLPAMLQRASDILGAFVGETEQQMAAMFRRARDEGAVLILDEADTFLADRQGARQRWEISAVNEMLTQMEAFEGLFVATTNLIDRLDEASLRRFDAKICFDYLRPAQVAALLRQACAGLGLDPAGCDEAATRLHKLTPGDFAAVMRQARFRPVHSLAELGTRLADEVAHKRGGGSGRPMGFKWVA
jgi:SpoVK/Ycf46/Vps4 family AAA+-type ATPase